MLSDFVSIGDALRFPPLRQQRLPGTRVALGQNLKRQDPVRAEVAEMSLRAAEKILRQGLDKSAQDRLIKETLGDLESSSGK